MSYRPDDQALEPHLDKILEGIEGIGAAIRKRLQSNDWNQLHKMTITQLRNDLNTLETRLLKLKDETW